MRPIVLVFVLIACGAVVFSFLIDGREASSGIEASAAAPTVQAGPSRTETSLESEPVEQVPATRTEASPPTTRLEIRIVDENGSAGAGMRLRLYRREDTVLHGRIGSPGAELPWIRTTDANGLAIWEGLEPGEECRWAAYSALVDYEPEPIGDEIGLSGSFALPAGKTTRLTGRLVPTLAIVGRIQDVDSKPLSGVRVTALRRDVDRRSVIMSNTTDAEGRFTLRRVRVVPLRLECVVFDSPDLLCLVTRDVDPGRSSQLDVGVWKLHGRTLRIALHAIDTTGRDVTDLAAIEGASAIPVQVEGCWEYPQQIRIPLGGSFRMIGFECGDVRIRIPQDPPLGSCAPGWVIDWNRSALDVSEGMEGDLRLDVLATRAEEIVFSASAIHRDGVPDQRGVAVLKVSLLSKRTQARLDFEMRALLGLAFDGVLAVPPGEYQLEASCEDEGALWTDTREVVVPKGAGEPIRIDLVRVR